MWKLYNNNQLTSDDVDGYLIDQYGASTSLHFWGSQS